MLRPWGSRWVRCFRACGLFPDRAGQTWQPCCASRGRSAASLPALDNTSAFCVPRPHPAQVFFPQEDRDKWDTRLLGPALLPAGGRKRQVNSQLHLEIWGTEYVRGGINDYVAARPQPDDLIKWTGAGGRARWGARWARRGVPQGGCACVPSAAAACSCIAPTCACPGAACCGAAGLLTPACAAPARCNSLLDELPLQAGARQRDGV